MRLIFASRVRSTALIASTFLAASCNSSDPGPGDFAAACNSNGDMTAELCACLDEQAQRLSPESHSFVIAKIAGDERTALRLREDLNEMQALEAGQFVSRAIQECTIDLPDTPE